MTDNEIIKAYGCCNLSHDECGGCDACPCKIEGECIVRSGFDLEREVFNLLNRQKAEIFKLQDELDWAEAGNNAVDLERIKAEEELEKAKAEIERLLKIAKNMHTWIFLNSGDEEEAYKECGLTLADNALFGYGGKIVLEIKEGEQV